jgi:DNA polymerase-3 subunit gamma/tau
MVLVRLAYAADLPSPEDVLKRLANAPPDGGGARTASAGTNGGSAPRAALAAPSVMQSQAAPANAPRAAAPEPRVRLHRFEDVVALAGAHRDIQTKIALERDVRLVHFEEGKLDFALAPGASPSIAQTFMRKLQEWTGIRWMVAISREEGAPTLKEVADAREQEKLTGVRAEPLVRSVLERFPGAEIVAIRSIADEPAPTAAIIAPETPDAGGDEIGYADETYTEDDL